MSKLNRCLRTLVNLIISTLMAGVLLGIVACGDEKTEAQRVSLHYQKGYLARDLGMSVSSIEICVGKNGKIDPQCIERIKPCNQD